MIKIQIGHMNGGLRIANLKFSLESLNGDRSLNLAWMLQEIRCIFLSVLTARWSIVAFVTFYGITLNVIFSHYMPLVPAECLAQRRHLVNIYW